MKLSPSGLAGLTTQITGNQKLHSEARAAQLLVVRVHLPCYAHVRIDH